MRASTVWLALILSTLLGCGDSPTTFILTNDLSSMMPPSDLAGVDLTGNGMPPDLSMAPVVGEPPALNGITAAHNTVRANAMPVPAPALSPLSWSNTLAQTAQSWADACNYMHSSNQYGENIYAAAGQVPTGPGVTDDWASEVSAYTYASNSCSNVCGHYTQIVWRSTIRLGCGIAMCNKNSPFSGFTDWTFVVCNYDPPGNYTGMKPY